MRSATPAKPSEPVEPAPPLLQTIKGQHAPGANLRTSSPNQKGDVK